MVKIIKWLFPYSVQKIESDVHKFYNDLGVQVTYTIPKLNMPAAYLVEGEVVDELRLSMVASADIIEKRVVKIW